MFLEKEIFEKFVPHYRKLRTAHFKDKIFGIVHWCKRIIGQECYYSSLFVDEAKIIGESKLFIDREILGETGASNDDWLKTILCLKNAAETLNKRNVFNSNNRIFVAALVTLSLVLISIVLPQISSEEIEVTKNVLIGAIGLLAIPVILEVENNRYYSGIYGEVANICEYISKLESNHANLTDATPSVVD